MNWKAITHCFPFVTRTEYKEHTVWQSKQRAVEWDRLMEHTHGEHGEVVFPDDDEKEECDE